MNKEKEAAKARIIIDNILPDEEIKTCYLVGLVKKEMKVVVLGTETPLKMNWADGMIGVMPVFKTIEDAYNYAGDKDVQIMEIKLSSI